MEMAFALYGCGTNDLPTYTTYWIMNAQVNEHGMAFSFYDRLTPSPIVVSIVYVVWMFAYGVQRNDVTAK